MRFFLPALVGLTFAISIADAGHLRRHSRYYQRDRPRLDLREIKTADVNSHSTLPVPLPKKDCDHNNDNSASPSATPATNSSATFNVAALQSSLFHFTSWINDWIAVTTADDTPLPQVAANKVASVLQSHQNDVQAFISTAQTHATASIGLQLADLQGFVVGFGDWTSTWIALAKSNGTSSRDAIASLQQDTTQYENSVLSWLKQANAPETITSVTIDGVTVSVTRVSVVTMTLSDVTALQTASAARMSDTVYASSAYSVASSPAPSASALTLLPIRGSAAPSAASSMPSVTLPYDAVAVAEPSTVPAVPSGSIEQTGIVSGCKFSSFMRLGYKTHISS